MRKESRCSHYRLDYPDLDEKKIGAHGLISIKVLMVICNFEKQPFDSWPDGVKIKNISINSLCTRIFSF